MYPENDGKSMEAEKNQLARFREPYLLAMGANKDGHTGCQFFITLDTMPALDGTSHTIFGRLLKGKETIKYLEGMQEYRSSADFIKRRIETMPLALGSSMHSEENKDASPTPVKQSRIVIKDSGVYKFERTDSQMIKTSAAGDKRFNPTDFLEARAKR